MNINQNLNDLMKEAQKMQQRMQEAQKELREVIVEGSAGGGKVLVKMGGSHDVFSCKIDPSLLEEEDVEMIQDLVAAAVNDAVRKVEKVSKEKISQLTAGLNIPNELMRDKDQE